MLSRNRLSLTVAEIRRQVCYLPIIASSGETIDRKLGASRYDRLGSIHDTFSLIFLNFEPLMPKMEKIKKREEIKMHFLPSEMQD